MRTIMALLTLIMLSHTATASKARLMALGQDGNGSLYIEDNRNIFLNPAKIYGLKNHLNFEMGGQAAASNPNAEGGFVTDYDNMKVGLQLGRQGHAATNITFVNSLITPNELIIPQNSFEVIVGKKSSDKQIGISIFYANSKSDTGAAANLPDDNASEITIKAGAILNTGLEVFGYFDAQQEAKHENAVAANTYDYSGGTNLGVGAAKVLSSGMKASAMLTLTSYDVENSGATSTIDDKVLVVNATNELKKTETTLVFATFGLRYRDGVIENPGSDTNLKTLSLPLVIGVEAKANDWMDLRASVSQTILVDTQENYTAAGNALKTENMNTTSVAAGVGIKWDNFTLDGTLTGSTTGVINAVSLISNASLTYNF